jgi:hypothetical protein
VSELAVEQKKGERIFVGPLFPAELHRNLKQLAEANDRPVAAELRHAVKSYMTARAA